ncbi:MAG: alpha/beta fold hydrolase [Tepidisphaeraceae bacterium]
MFWFGSLVLTGVYFVLPVLSIAFAWRKCRRRRRSIVGAWLSGLLIAASLLAAYSIALGNRVPTGQAALTLYLGVGLMLFLRGYDAGLRKLVQAVFRPTPASFRSVLAGLARFALLAGVAIPWVMAAAMVYRPRIPVDDSGILAIAPTERVNFPTSDGKIINGWYTEPAEAGDTTALVIHGLGGSPAGMVRLIDALHAANIAVLAIDLSAHGESTGQRCTYGIKERNDAVAAVEWLKANHPEQAARVVGVGASLGAAALIGAAAEHARLDGVAVLSTYASLPAEVDAISRQQLGGPIGWLVRNFGLPFASLHAGVDLRSASPVTDIANAWPTPFLIVHGTRDEIIPFDQGRALFDAAPIGRSHFWVTDGTHNGILDDVDVIQRVIRFIQTAAPMPVV